MRESCTYGFVRGARSNPRPLYDLLLAALASTAILAGTAYAQTQEGGAAPVAKDRPTTAPNTTGVAPPGTPQRPTGPAIGRPNEPRAYGETDQGTRVNPDRTPPLAPGGQGETGNR